MKITGFFTDFKNAWDTAEELRNAGYPDAVADLNDHCNGIDTETNQPGTEASSNSLADLVLKSGNHVTGQAKGPLAAASPMVSGMGNLSEIDAVRYQVIVNADESKVDEVKNIIKSKGGEFKNPHVGTPEGLENVGLEEVIMSNIENI
ncbi:MAG: hypothetical protein GX930_06105 [Clostridia bacterium]|nr:hypothetical protein [Clostridia bacterium]